MWVPLRFLWFTLSNTLLVTTKAGTVFRVLACNNNSENVVHVHRKLQRTYALPNVIYIYLINFAKLSRVSMYCMLLLMHIIWLELPVH